MQRVEELPIAEDRVCGLNWPQSTQERPRIPRMAGGLQADRNVGAPFAKDWGFR
jgi:hypothetical protein